jgi:hypothetical protein
MGNMFPQSPNPNVQQGPGIQVEEEGAAIKRKKEMAQNQQTSGMGSVGETILIQGCSVKGYLKVRRV